MPPIYFIFILYLFYIYFIFILIILYLIIIYILVKWAPVTIFDLASPVSGKMRGETRSLLFFLILPRPLPFSRPLFSNFSLFFHRFLFRAPSGPNANLFIFNIIRITVSVCLFTLLLLLFTLFYYYILTNHGILTLSILSRFLDIRTERSFVRPNLFRRRNLPFKKNLLYYISR